MAWLEDFSLYFFVTTQFQQPAEKIEWNLDQAT